jgi:hypothetical protein
MSKDRLDSNAVDLSRKELNDKTFMLAASFY